MGKLSKAIARDRWVAWAKETIAKGHGAWVRNSGGYPEYGAAIAHLLTSEAVALAEAERELFVENATVH